MSYSLEEVLLGWKQKDQPEKASGVAPEPVEEQKALSTVELKILTRRIRVIELRCEGCTIARICEKLREEHIEVSERTVWDDLHSPQAQELIEELTRQQLQDIASLKKASSRLHWRDVLLEKLLPRKQDKVEVNVNASAQSSSESTASLLADYDPLIAQEMLTEAGDLLQDGSAKQVHQAQAANPA
jgi:hypothetical protein